MATNASNNSFTLSGFVAVDAKVNNFEKSSVARFPLSVSRKEKDGEQTVRKSALVTVECWRKAGNTATFDLLKKGKLINISGFIRPEEWESKDGTKQSGIVFVATSIEEAKAAEDAPEEKPAPKGKKSKKEVA